MQRILLLDMDRNIRLLSLDQIDAILDLFKRAYSPDYHLGRNTCLWRAYPCRALYQQGRQIQAIAVIYF